MLGKIWSGCTVFRSTSNMRNTTDHKTNWNWNKDDSLNQRWSVCVVTLFSVHPVPLIFSYIWKAGMVSLPSTHTHTCTRSHTHTHTHTHWCNVDHSAWWEAYELRKEHWRKGALSPEHTRSLPELSWNSVFPGLFFLSYKQLIRGADIRFFPCWFKCNPSL